MAGDFTTCNQREAHQAVLTRRSMPSCSHCSLGRACRPRVVRPVGAKILIRDITVWGGSGIRFGVGGECVLRSAKTSYPRKCDVGTVHAELSDEEIVSVGGKEFAVWSLCVFLFISPFILLSYFLDFSFSLFLSFFLVFLSFFLLLFYYVLSHLFLVSFHASLIS